VYVPRPPRVPCRPVGSSSSSGAPWRPLAWPVPGTPGPGPPDRGIGPVWLPGPPGRGTGPVWLPGPPGRGTGPVWLPGPPGRGTGPVWPPGPGTEARPPGAPAPGGGASGRKRSRPRVGPADEVGREAGETGRGAGISEASPESGTSGAFPERGTSGALPERGANGDPAAASASALCRPGTPDVCATPEGDPKPPWSARPRPCPGTIGPVAPRRESPGAGETEAGPG
jgi:hypothetical protein